MVDAVRGPQPGRTERERVRDASVVQYHPEETVNASREDDGEQPVEASVDDGVDADEEGATEDSGFDDEMFEAFEDIGEDSESAETDGEAVASTDGGAQTERPAANGDSPASKNGEHDGASEFSAEAIMDALNSVTERPVEEEKAANGLTPREEIERSMHEDAEFVDDESESEPETAPQEESAKPHDDQEPVAIRELKADIAGFPTKTRKMLEFYREQGPGTPLNAHFAAGGDGDRTNAYAHNRRLRTRGLIEHVGRGKYEYRLRPLLRDELDGIVDPETLDAYVSRVEDAVLSG